MYAKFLFTSNELPQTNDSTSAITNRLIFVPMNNVIKEKDIHFIDNINLEDKQYLLNLALEGIKRIYSHKWETIPRLSQNMMDIFQKNINSAFQFVNEIIEGKCEIEVAEGMAYHLKNEGEVSLKDFYDNYKIWCGDQGINPNFRFRKKRFMEEIEKTKKCYLIDRGNQWKVKWK